MREQGYSPISSPPALNPPRGGSATAWPPRPDRRMVKCYFTTIEPNAKCIGYIAENLAQPRGNVTYFEEWFLLPVGFSPRRKVRRQIVEQARRAMSDSMSQAKQGIRDAAVSFYPTPVPA